MGSHLGSGGWRARVRAAALMYAAGAVLAVLSMLPAQPPAVHRQGILAIAAVAALSALGIVLLGRRYSVVASHVTSVIGAVLVAVAQYLTGGTSLGLVYSSFFIWVVLFSLFFHGTRGAMAHATVCSVGVVVGLANRPTSDRAVTWAVTVATLYVLVVCYHIMSRHSARLNGLVENSGGVVTIVDRDLRIGYQTAAVQRVLGYQPDELVGSELLALVHPDDRDHVRAVLTAAVHRGRAGTVLECRLRHRDGSWRHAESSVENLLDDGAIDGVVLSFRDVTDRRALQDQLAHQAFHDPLTGLANRALFSDRLEHALARQQRLGEPVGVLLIDIDDFKSVNDNMGHAAGDDLLVAVSRRLRDSVRSTDTVARLGGDEFAVLLEDPQPGDAPGGDDLRPGAERLLQAFGKPVTVDGTQVFVGLSIGGAEAAGAGTEQRDLLRDADAAMYAAKQAGKGRYERFEPGLNDHLLRRQTLRQDLREAVERGEISLVYQPTVTLEGGHVTAVEALARWQHPRFGSVSPGEFIPVAEEAGLVVALGRWVLDEACGQARRWGDEDPACEQLQVMINVSVRQLQDEAFVDDVLAALRRSGLQPWRVVLEVTESAVLTDLGTAVERLARLRAAGVMVAVDDFGTGHSSLGRLHTLPVDIVKIDKSFVDDLGQDPHAEELVAGVIDLIGRVGLRSLAEGIEYHSQLDCLRRLGCGYGQGFLFARPLPAAAVPACVAQRSTVVVGLAC